MSGEDTQLPTSRRRRVAVGYRVQVMPDRTVEVMLEAALLEPGTPVGANHRLALRDYMTARRAAREENRRLGKPSAAPPP